MSTRCEACRWGRRQPAARADDRPPYRGLETFDEEHADVFFGREGDVQRLLEKLKASRFLAVLGPSGSGKSSLVRAGLVPALRRGAVPGSETWQICLLRPGARPLTALAAQLAHVVPGGAMQRTLDGLAADERTLHLAVALTLADTAPSARVVLVVDQLEEAFTLARDETERERFLANLVYAASVPDGQAVVVTTMRADFYPRLAAYPEAAQLTAAHQALVAPLDEEGLRQAIEEPARRVGLELEEGLVDTILEDVEHQSGALPLLEHALLELWRRRRGTMLTLEAYRETGGVGGALARRADGVFASFTPEQQEVARRTFLRLTQPGEGTEDTRRRARLDELASSPADSDEVDAVVRALVDARMLTTGGGGGGEQWVDVSHEALIRGWPRLRRWLDDDRAGLRVHRRLTEATEEWERLDRDAGTLFRGARLVEAVEWRRRNEDVLNPLEREFLDASAASAKREQRQAQRRVRWTIAGMTLALLLIGAGALVAVHQRSIAAEQRDEAVSAANVARAANAVDGDPIAAVRLALDAVHAKRTPDATRALRQAVGAARLRKTLTADGSTLWAADATADGTRAVTADDRGLVRIWDLGARTRPARPARAPRPGLRRRSLARRTVRRHRRRRRDGPDLERLLGQADPRPARAGTGARRGVQPGRLARRQRRRRSARPDLAHERRSVAALDSRQLGLDRGRRIQPRRARGRDRRRRRRDACLGRRDRPTSRRRSGARRSRRPSRSGPATCSPRATTPASSASAGRRRRSCAGTPTPCGASTSTTTAGCSRPRAATAARGCGSWTQARRSRPWGPTRRSCCRRRSPTVGACC